MELFNRFLNISKIRESEILSEFEMAPRESIFTNSSPSLADLKDAVEKVEVLIATKRLEKKLFYDMLLGFRLLEQSLHRRQSEAYKMILIWLSLYLKIQFVINGADEEIRDKFEKLVPSAVTYMIGCLQHKTKDINSFHYQILEMMYELLSNVHPGVLEKLANFESGIISCIWFPIDFVGDFNTQMMALRLLVMLLKCVDLSRLQNELKNICSADKSVMREKLTATIAVANFHASKFENNARDLLNTYNMHLAKTILVYSFRCKEFKFGDNIEFFKPLNADHFWIDFNYCPRTLSFNGRCQANNQKEYTNCSVNLQIIKLSLNGQSLSLQFQGPIQLINASEDIPDLCSTTKAEILLPREEAMRLLENKFILTYYNKVDRHWKASVVKLHKTSKDVEKITLESTATVVNNLIPKNKNAINFENKENVPPEEQSTKGIYTQRPTTQGSIRTTTNMEEVSKQFQKSFDFLIGLSNKDNKQVNSKHQTQNSAEVQNSLKAMRKKNLFRLPQVSNGEKQPNHENKEKSHQISKSLKIVEYSTSTSESRPQSSASTKESVKKPHRRFFKTTTSNSESDYIPMKTKNVPRKRNIRTKRQPISTVSSKKSKQVNEVKPMLHSNEALTPKEVNNNQNRSIHEISAISNVDEHNVNTINHSPLIHAADVYENCLVSDAEPGLSYRNFKIRRNLNDYEKETIRTKRSRTSLPRAVKKEVPKAFLHSTHTQVSRRIKGRKRALDIDPFDDLKERSNVPNKIGKPEKAASFSNENQNIYSRDIENIAELVLRRCTSYKQKQTLGNSCLRNCIVNSKPNEILNNSLNLNEVPKASMQSFQENIIANQVEDNDIRQILSVSVNAAEVGVDQLNEIQECRRDVDRNEACTVHDYDEFSDCPTFPHLMNISDMLPSSESESTKNEKIDIKRLTGVSKSLPETKLSVIPNQIYESNKLMPHNSVIYYSRSENDNNSDSDCDKSIVSQKNALELIVQPLEPPQQAVVTPQLSSKNFQKTTSVTKCHVTTTATSIITHQDHVIRHEEFVANLSDLPNAPLNLSKSCSRAHTTTTTKTVVKENTEINANSFIQRSMPMNITTLAPKVMEQESSNMISAHKANLNLQLDHLETDVNKNSTNMYITKICDVGERILNEIERERKSLSELESNAQRLARQLDWQYEAYHCKTQQFECFKRNIETLLRVLGNVNLCEEIENDSENKIKQLQQKSNSMTTQKWRAFINETTENLLKDISSLSDL